MPSMLRKPSCRVLQLPINLSHQVSLPALRLPSCHPSSQDQFRVLQTGFESASHTELAWHQPQSVAEGPSVQAQQYASLHFCR